MSNKIIPTALTAILLLLTCVHTTAQTPQEYFVTGANLFIDGETEKARSLVDAGIVKYPDDKKLQALKKAIEEDKKDQNQDQNQKQDQNKENQQDQNKDQNRDQENKNKEQQQDKQNEQGSISKEDAQRLLDALANDEKNVQEKVKEAKAAKAKVRTLINW